MSKDVTVYMIAGQIGAGKTTFAKKLENETNGIRFTPDEWIKKLSLDSVPNKDFDSYFYSACDIAWNLAKKLINKRIDIILDFGFWKRQTRDKYKERIKACKAKWELYYVYCPDNIIRQRLKERNKLSFDESIVISEQMYDYFSPEFEAPIIEEEQAKLIKNND